jgi:ribonuclease HII
MIDRPEILPYELSSNIDLIAGVDEVGRGCLFGMVVAAAVILPKAEIDRCQAWGIKDSKKLSATRRAELAPKIEQIAIAHAIGIATVAEIDDLNILQAALLAMNRAISELNTTPELCLIDGNKPIPDFDLPQQTLIKGEDRSVSIAAASILAKVWRDRAMTELAITYPMYDLTNNKGYGTAKHLRAIEQFGISPEHRRSFSPVRQAMVYSPPSSGKGGSTV